MFFPDRNPASPDPRRFAVLRSSLNAPVVATEDLPSGPARAVIVMWWADDESPVLEVRMRSVTTGRLVTYGFDGTLDNAGELETALEGALNFAETMGFVFDDDVLSGDDTVGREKVVEAWEAFEEGKPPPRRSDPGRMPSLAEITRPGLDEPVELTELVPAKDEDDADLAMELSSDWSPDNSGLDLPVEPEPPAVEASRDAVTESPEVTLTKFRGPAAGGEPEAAPASSGPPPGGRTRQALGRVPIVRRRGKKNTREAPSLLSRILGAF